MADFDDGGPAFPVADAQSASPRTLDEGKSMARGMSLRDYFAAKAMQAQLITDGQPGEAADILWEEAQRAGQDPVYRLALLSYDMADAMLKAREARNG